MGVVKAICISEHKGTQKTFVAQANFIEGFGIENDAHGGDWHRQVSLLSQDKIADFNAQGANVFNGAFGENLIIEGIELEKLPIGSKLICNEVELEVTQIGKECYVRCHIFHKMGDCIMPKFGIFAKVLTGGSVKIGDEMICRN